MKTLQDIQYNIKEKEKMHIIMDFEGVISSLNSSYNTELFSPIYKRIFENFAKKEFINFTILINKKDKKFRSKSIYKNTNLQYEDINIFKENMQELQKTEYEPLYIGLDKDIATFFRENNFMSVCVNPEEDIKKLFTLWLSKESFIKFLTETNNVCL